MGLHVRPPIEDHPETDEQHGDEVQNDVENDGYGVNRNDLPVSMNSPEGSAHRFRVGMELDVKDSVGVWSEAEVMKVSTEREEIYVTFTYWADRWDIWLSMHDEDRIAPLHTHTYVEGLPLRVGQRIEVQDSFKKWFEAFVIEETPAEVKVHYKNYHSKFDEWLPRDSDRVRSFGRHKTNLNAKRVVQMRRWHVPTEENIVDLTAGSKSSSSSQQNSYKAERDQRYADQHSVSTMNSSAENNYSRYLAALSRQGLSVVPVDGDGNCLFRSVAHQLYGNDGYHLLVREKCIDYMQANANFYSQFVVGGTETFHLYLAAKRRSGVWGDDPEIQAICELYNLPAQIWAFDRHSGARKLRTFHENSQVEGHTTSFIRLSYYGGGHYDSVVVGDVTTHRKLLVEPPGEVEDRAVARASRIESRSGSSHSESNALQTRNSNTGEYTATRDQPQSPSTDFDDLASAVRASLDQQRGEEDKAVEQAILQRTLEESRRALLHHLSYEGTDADAEILGVGGCIEQEYLLQCMTTDCKTGKVNGDVGYKQSADKATVDDDSSAMLLESECKLTSKSDRVSSAKFVHSEGKCTVDEIPAHSTSRNDGDFAPPDAKGDGVRETENELLTSAIQASEMEYLDEQYQQVSCQHELEDTEAKDIQLAMEMSLKEGNLNSGGVCGTAPGTAFTDPDTERAIRESLRDHIPASISDSDVSQVSAIGTSSSTYDIPIVGSEDDFNEEMYLAIQASLKDAK